MANPLGVSIHRAGGVLDLVFTDDPTAQVIIAASAYITSDHDTLQFILSGPTPPKPAPGRLRLNNAWDRPLFLRLLVGATQIVSDDVDIEAEDLTQVIYTAFIGSALRIYTKSIGARWWTDACKEAAYAYRRVRRTGPADDEKRALWAITRKVKRAYWRSIVEGADDLVSLYKVTNWYRGSLQYLSPPLQRPAAEGGIAVTPNEKQELLHHTLLSRHLDAADISLDYPAALERRMEWATLDAQEAYSAACQVTTTAPGQDEITARVLCEVWPLFGNRIVTLYDRCFRLG